MKRLIAVASAVLLATLPFGGEGLAQPAPEFKLGFKALADQIPTVVGQPMEDEHWGDNGDSLQQTTTGLMAWRKADNWTAFTDGARTWVNGPFGVMERGNGERFDWEAPGMPASAPAAAAPAPTAMPPAPSAGPASGVQSETPAGAWVTSSYRTAKYYYAASDPRWQELSPQYRVWFATKDDLVRAFPDRLPAP